MLDRGSADDLLTATVFDTDGNKIGRVGRVYMDDSGGQPEWVTVQTGLFGSKESFLPLGQARLDGDRLVVPIAKDAVKHAPHIDPETGHLSLEEEEQLYRHYGLSHADESDSGDQPEAGAQPPTAGYSPAVTDGSSTGMDSPETVQPTVDAPETVQPTVDAPPPAEQSGMPPAGLRLRRHLITEDQQITVPVVREEYILEPDPESGGDPAADPIGESQDESPSGTGR